jgi:putative ABC transport system substrate-binding protein
MRGVIRRELLKLIVGYSAGTWSTQALTQPRVHSRPLVAYLAGQSEIATAPLIAEFLRGLREHGHAVGQDIDIIYRFAEGNNERLPALAEELVRLKPSIILATSVVCTVAARRATTTIPIVTPPLADAVHLGLVASHNRPGGNVTGITPYVDGLPAKQFGLAREMVPSARRVGILGNLNDPKAPPQQQELEAVGLSLGITTVVGDVRVPADVDAVTAGLARESVDVVVVLQTNTLISERRRIAAAFAAHGLPAVYGYREHVDDGGLISYGVDLRWCWHRAATFVHKILNGERAGDLPLEFPTHLVLAVNLQTAKALKLEVPAALLARADVVVE